jgi:phytanoyl-CoA hydroxylase
MPTDTAIPFFACEDASPDLADSYAFRDFFRREGYIIMRKALPAEVCAEAVDGFLKEVHLDNRALFLRDCPSRYEPHCYTDAGHMRYPIVNLQDISGRRYPQFKAAGLALLTDPVLRRAMQTLLGEPARLGCTMYFDSNLTELPQRDSLRNDFVRPAAMIGAWIAAEDSDAGAGRLFVVPGSHRRQDLSASAGPGTRRKVAPLLKQGDVLLWSAMTLHGNLPATTPGCSRRAFAGQYTGRSVTSSWRSAGSTVLGDMEVMHYRDQRSLSARAVALLRSEYPGAYGLLRRVWTRRR